jgi:large subunit ribosomal protein L5
MAKQTPRLKQLYLSQVSGDLISKFGLKNPMQAPKLKKITVNMGLGGFGKEKKALAEHTEELALITGQKPMVRHSTKAAATFKLREGDAVGVMVTLRGDKMWYFLEKLINVACPRIRDFNGLKHGFDRQGNYSVGLQDQGIFPEIKVEKISRAQGMDICMTITGGSDDLSREMLLGLGFPLKRPETKKD